MIEDINRDVFVRIQTDLLVVGDCIMTDRHHASNGNYEDTDPQNQIGGIIPAFPLSGWLRHGTLPGTCLDTAQQNYRRQARSAC